jgi:hypothetical protein
MDQEPRFSGQAPKVEGGSVKATASRYRHRLCSEEHPNFVRGVQLVFGPSAETLRLKPLKGTVFRVLVGHRSNRFGEKGGGSGPRSVLRFGGESIPVSSFGSSLVMESRFGDIPGAARVVEIPTFGGVSAPLGVESRLAGARLGNLPAGSSRQLDGL